MPPDAEPRHRVLWITNFAAPYRVPVWRSIARRADLRVGLLESDERIGTRGHERGRDWKSDASQGIRTVPLRVVSASRWRTYTYTLFPWLGSGVRGADVVVLGNWEAPAFWQLLVAARILRKRVVVFSESTLWSRRRSSGPIAAARRRFFRLADAVVVPGVAAREAVLDLDVDPSRIHLGFNAVDVAAFAASPRRSVDPAGHRFLFVGQLIARKRPIELVWAFRRIAGDSDRLTFVGSGPLEPALIEAIGDDGRIAILPYVPNAELPAVFAAHDTLVLPSSEEVWGLVVNEALAAGLHVVVSERCGVRPSVEGMAGVYVAKWDLSDLDSSMRSSREKWSGPIGAPEILAYTPERFADVFLQAFGTI